MVPSIQYTHLIYYHCLTVFSPLPYLLTPPGSESLQDIMKSHVFVSINESFLRLMQHDMYAET